MVEEPFRQRAVVASEVFLEERPLLFREPIRDRVDERAVDPSDRTRSVVPRPSRRGRHAPHVLANRAQEIGARRLRAGVDRVERSSPRHLHAERKIEQPLAHRRIDRAGEAARAGVRRILLTASGGPFRATPLERLAEVTPDEACAHPNWVMGRKISVDSATMMNKALEVIEARWLFDLAPEQVRVLIHPQSIVHSMVVCRDNSVLAQLGTPDMRVPIAVGLAYPQRIESGAARLDIQAMSQLSFETIDLARFPGLQLGWDSLRAPAGSTAVLNAANEIAVEAFLAGAIRFDQIHAVNLDTLSAVTPDADSAASIDALLALDARARREASRQVAGRAA